MHRLRSSAFGEKNWETGDLVQNAQQGGMCNGTNASSMQQASLQSPTEGMMVFSQNAPSVARAAPSE
jgi:hypothetical protein